MTDRVPESRERAARPSTARGSARAPELVATKLGIPPVRADLVPRERLVQALSRFGSRKLALVSAPAGFGKTTLVATWAQQSGIPVGWVSLDAGDSDPVRFWSYFVAALRGL